jgi:hypothetical protein
VQAYYLTAPYSIINILLRNISAGDEYLDDISFDVGVDHVRLYSDPFAPFQNDQVGEKQGSKKADVAGILVV